MIETDGKTVLRKKKFSQKIFFSKKNFFRENFFCVRARVREVCTWKKFFGEKIFFPEKIFFSKKNFFAKKNFIRKRKFFFQKKNFFAKKFFFQKKCFLQNYFCARARCAREILRSPRFQQYPTSRYLRPKSQFFAPSARARSWGHPGSNDTPQVGIWGQKISFSRLARARASCPGRARVTGSRRFQRYMTCGPRCPGTQRIPPSPPFNVI